MRKFVLLWIGCNPDAYVGHRIHDFQRETLNEAKEEVYDFLDTWMRHGWLRGNWEIRLLEIGGNGYDSGYRLFDNRDAPHRNEREYDYSMVNFFLNDEEDEFANNALDISPISD